jgi:hypothetical protein
VAKYNLLAVILGPAYRHRGGDWYDDFGGGPVPVLVAFSALALWVLGFAASLLSPSRLRQHRRQAWETAPQPVEQRPSLHSATAWIFHECSSATLSCRPNEQMSVLSNLETSRSSVSLKLLDVKWDGSDRYFRARDSFRRHGRDVWSFWLKLLVLVLTGATSLAAWDPESSFPPILRPEV